MNPSLLNGLQNTTTSLLRKTDISQCHDRSAANPSALASPDVLEEEESRWKYFFDTGCENWFSLIKDQTFTSTFCTLTPTEASIIVKHWEDRNHILSSAASHENQSSEQTELEIESLTNEARHNLSELLSRLAVSVDTESQISSCGKVFVKLATRSPKDSKLILKQAEMLFNSRIEELNARNETEVDDNLKWILLSEEVTKASAVSNAAEAVDLLLDSARVFEDLEYALRGPPDSDKNANEQIKVDGDQADDESTLSLPCFRQWQMNLVTRAWDPRLKPCSEFRGICWDNKLTCLAQYYHPLYFEELQSVEVRAVIEEDVKASFEMARAAVAQLGGHCIIDFAWLSKGEVVIVELNPFDGVCLGTFPASTGLFLFEDPMNQTIMKGEAPFEFRIRETKLTGAQLGANGNAQWREIIKPMKHQVSIE